MSIEFGFKPIGETSNKKWDVFISHASEDKENFVRPLAEKLQKCGVKVWYDEFELKMGDSLSDSIDRGLQESKYGIIVFSHAFFEKEWTNYELKSLYLLDIKALSSEMGWDELVDNILEIVRPDIIDSHLMLKMGVELHKRAKELPIVEISASELHISPIRHQTLPVHLIIASRLISEVFWDVLPMDYVDMVTDFARDLDYDKEFIIWSAIANSYVAFVRETQCGVNDVSKKREAISLLLTYSHKGQLEEVSCLKNINEREYYYLIKLFIDNYNHIMDMVKKYN